MQPLKKIQEEQHPEKLESLFNAFQVETMIKTTEKELAAGMVILNDLTPGFREVEEMYKHELEKFSMASQAVENFKTLLETLARYRQKMKPSKEMRILRTTSHTDKPVKDRKRIAWEQIMVAALKKLNRFTQPSILFDIIVEDYEIVRLANANNKHFKHSNVFQMKLKAAKKKSPLCVYEKMLGLREWLNENKQPKDNYLKPFMYK